MASLTADRDFGDDDGNEQADALMERQSSSAPTRFCAADLLGDERLAEAAMRELHTGVLQGGHAQQQQQHQQQQQSQQHDGILTYQRSSRHTESAPVEDEHMERMRAAAQQLDEDVDEETTMSCELADLIIRQLEQSKGDIAQVASVLGAIHAAEAAWSNAMRHSIRAHKLPSAEAQTATRPTAAARHGHAPSGAAGANGSKGPTPSSTESPSAPGTPTSNPSCAQALAALPSALLAARQELCAALPPLQQQLQQLVARYQRACRELGGERDATSKAVEAQRAALRQATAQHASAAGALEAVLQGRAAGRRVPLPSGAVDPWHCEHAMLQALRALIRLQDKELAFVQTCFSQARDLELQRGDAFRQVLSTLSDGQTSMAHATLAAVLRATGLTPGGAADGEQALAQHAQQAPGQGQAAAPTRAALLSNTKLEELTRAAATASEAAQGLASKQGESVQAVKAELFCSPEIVRQGELESWDGVGQWRSGHAVLTRASGLFIFALAPEGDPGDLRVELNLARMQFEAGQAPRFHLVQEASLGGAWAALLPGSGGRPQKLSFQAASVEECCEWAIAIREAIAIANGKQ